MPKVSFLRGQDLSASVLNQALSGLGRFGIFKEADLTVDNNNLLVSAHSGAFGNGAVLVETNTSVRLPNTSAQASLQTLCYEMDPSYEIQPKLGFKQGWLRPYDDDNILVVGYMKYPGNNVVHTSAMFLPCKQRKEPRVFQHFEPTMWLPSADSVPSSVAVEDSYTTSEQRGRKFSNIDANEVMFNWMVPCYSMETPESLELSIKSMDSGVRLIMGISYEGNTQILNGGSLFGTLQKARLGVSLMEYKIQPKKQFWVTFSLYLPAYANVELSGLSISNELLLTPQLLDF